MNQRLITLIITILVACSSVVSLAYDEQNTDSLTATQRVEILWFKYLNEQLDPIEFYSGVKELTSSSLLATDIIRLSTIKNSFEGYKSDIRLNVTKSLSENEALKLASDWKFVEQVIGHVSETNENKIKQSMLYLDSIKSFKKKSVEEVKDLFYRSPDYAYYNNGEYKNTLKVYLFCRHDRRYPCLFVMRDIFDNPVRNNDGSLWTLPGLAHSRRELPYNVTNGYTPSGVHTLDSVMPDANRPQAFGKWRRVKLNWIPKSDNEVNTIQFLPKSAHDKKWWHEANVARDVGRKWLRIHGTGNRNYDRTSPFYTFFATAGCIATREMNYDGVEYKDQRIILDKMMESMRLAPVYQNEVNIKGVIYVVELDDKKEKVTAETLKSYGIE